MVKRKFFGVIKNWCKKPQVKKGCKSANKNILAVLKSQNIGVKKGKIFGVNKLVYKKVFGVKQNWCKNAKILVSKNWC